MQYYMKVVNITTAPDSLSKDDPSEVKIVVITMAKYISSELFV